MKRVLVTTRETVNELCEKLSNAEDVGFDTESSGPQLVSGKMLNVYKSSLTGCSFAFDDSTAYYLPVRHLTGNCPSPLVKRVMRTFAGATARKWAHNWKHDLLVLAREGYILHSNVHDTMILMWLIQRSDAKGKYGLKGLIREYFGEYPITFKEVVGDREWYQLPPSEGLHYATDDAVNTLNLSSFYGDIATYKLEEAYEMEHAFIPVILNMESAGMGLDQMRLLDLSGELDIELEELQMEWDFLFPGVNIRSGKQVREALFDAGHWPAKFANKTKTGQLGVDKESLERFSKSRLSTADGRSAALVKLQFQYLDKNRSTYTTSLVDCAAQFDDQRIHPSYHQTGTATGRLSCSDPNLQNIPARSEVGLKVKECFIPREGYVYVAADYSQIELRVLAHLAREGALFDAYTKGADIHQQTADLVGCDRTQAKTINFAVVYGAHAKKIAGTIGSTYAEAAKFMEKYNEAYPEVSSLRSKVVASVRARGYIRTLGGRIRRIDTDMSDRVEKWRAERLAFNTPVQGGAADIVKMAMIDVYKDIVCAGDGRMVSQVHDELCLEVKEEHAKEIVCELKMIMENAYPTRVPLVAEPVIAKNWKECK